MDAFPLDEGKRYPIQTVVASANTMTWSQSYCGRLTRLSRSNFYVSFLFLPKNQRRAMHAIYAFCRMLDDCVDSAADVQAAAKGLERWKRCLDDAYRGRATHPIMLELMQAIETYALPKEYFLALVEGVGMDLSYARYQTFSELESYCYRVAGVVGLMCIKVFGYRNPNTTEFAKNLGLALQLTNIARDVAKDAQLGRIYIPLEDCARFGVGEQEILQGLWSDRFAALMAFECDRARSYYRAAEALWDSTQLRTLFPAIIMKTLYQRLLEKIVESRYDVFHHSVCLGTTTKFLIALTIYTQARFSPHV